PGRVGHAVEIAADADHAFVRSAPLEPQHRPVGCDGQGFQRRSILGEGLVDDPVGGRMHARIGDRIEPMTELLVQVVEVAERAAEEEVLADVAEWPLDFTLCFGPIGPAGARLEAIMASKVDEGAVVDDEPVGVLADDRGLHAIVEDRARRAADRLEGGDVAAQDTLQILVEDEPRPDQPGVAEHHRDSQTMRLTPGSSTNSTSNRASYPALRAGRSSRTRSRTTL